MLCVFLSIGVEHRAVNAFASIFLVNQTLVGINYHNQIFVIIQVTLLCAFACRLVIH